MVQDEETQDDGGVRNIVFFFIGIKYSLENDVASQSRI